MHKKYFLTFNFLPLLQAQKCFFFQFQFVNSFLALFYTAFYLQDMDKLKEVKNNIFEALKCALTLQDY